MLKRFAACLLALTFLSGGVLASAADETDIQKAETQQSGIVEELNTPTFSVSSAKAKPGDTVELTVDMSNNPGITSLMVSVSYNDSYISLASYPVFSDIFTESLGSGDLAMIPYNLLCMEDVEDITEDGTLATLTFKVAENAPSGDYTVAISYEEEAVFNVKLEDVFFETVAGKITVEGDIPEVTGEDAPAIYDPITDKPGSDEPEEDAFIVPKFADTLGHWAVKFINDSVDLGLFRGDENGNFNPEQKITRAQFITVLWRMAGTPDIEATHSFDDVDGQSEEFQKAIAWGYAKGYVSGISDTQFDPNGMLTREAGMKMLHYYSGGKVGQEAMFYQIYDGMIKDSAEISDWAKKSVYWGIYYEMISGTDNLTISPKTPMTRAQMAKIMVTYHNNIAS